MQKVEFDIQGMTCSSCSAHVDKAVNRLNGVKNVNVNLLSNSMTLEYDENTLTTEDIVKAVVGAGYGATLAVDTTVIGREGHHKKELNRMGRSNRYDNTKMIYSMKKRMILSFIFLILLMFVSMHHMFFEILGLQVPEWIKAIFYGNENALTYALTQFLLLLPIIYFNRNYFTTGLKRLFKFSPNMDSLIAMGSGIATLYGIFAIYRIGYGLGHGDMQVVEHYRTNLYFESAGMILTLITFGKFLEAISKGKTSDSISKLINLAPKTALVIKDGKEVEIKTEEIQKNDIVVIKPGSSIPVDGVIVEGSSSIDQSSITGESIPVPKNVHDEVISGTINKNGYFKMQATKVGNDTTLSQIIQLVEEASNSKAPISKLADKISLVFVPVVICIAIMATVFWLVNGQTFEFAIGMGISVLVISCPCALGLATPVAIMVGTGRGAENGILYKTAESLELLHKVDTIVLDKTGTITKGKPVVTDVISTISEEELLQIAGSLEKNSEHPLSEAVMEKVNEKKISLMDVNHFQSIPGKGVFGEIAGNQYFVGNLLLMQEQNIEIRQEESEKYLMSGKTVLYVAKEKQFIGMIACQDVVKDTSKVAIKELQKENKKVVMLTGDNQLSANAIAKELGIQEVVAEVLPADKEKEIVKLQEEGRKVAFVGDGINDSPALVKADIGLAIGSGTDIAIESADVILMRDNLLDVATAIELSKATMNNIKLNLFWAFFYNCIGIPIAAGVFYLSHGLRLSPMIGALAMSFSSVCVVTNALRLREFQSRYQKKNHSKDNNLMKEEREMGEIKKEVFINGMMCNHCKMRVEKALSEIEHVSSVTVSLEDKKAVVYMSSNISNDILKSAVTEAGYEVTEIKGE